MVFHVCTCGDCGVAVGPLLIATSSATQLCLYMVVIVPFIAVPEVELGPEPVLGIGYF